MVQKARRKAGAEVWSEHELVTLKKHGDRSEKRVGAKVVPREHRFRQALEERGGLFTVFGQFLSGRADLLPASYLPELRGIKRSGDSNGAELLAREAGGKLSAFHLIRVAPCAEVYAATYENHGIVVEVYQPANVFIGPSWDEFQREIRVLEGGPESPVTRSPVIESFGLWLQLQADIARKRTVLGNLRDVPGSIICHFPALISSVQSSRCLAYEAAVGRPVEDDLRIRPNPAIASLQSLTEALLEQSLLLSVVDADLLIENYVWSDGGIGFRAVPALSPVPVEWHDEFLQYVVCVIAGDTRRAIQMLARMSAGWDPGAAERALLRGFAGLQPDLKMKVSTPGAVSAFETYRRAYAASGLMLAPFLELFHRQMTMLGQWHADISASSDLTTESLWAVMGRILRFRVSQNLTLEKTRGWVVGSGLLAMASTRQLAASLTQVRDGDGTVILDQEGDEERGANLGLRTAAIVGAAVAMALFALLVSQAIGATTFPAKFLFSAAILISGAMVSILISRID